MNYKQAYSNTALQKRAFLSGLLKQAATKEQIEAARDQYHRGADAAHAAMRREDLQKALAADPNAKYWRWGAPAAGAGLGALAGGSLGALVGSKGRRLAWALGGAGLGALAGGLGAWYGTPNIWGRYQLYKGHKAIDDRADLALKNAN